TVGSTYNLSFLIANEGEASSQSVRVLFPSGSATGAQTFTTSTGAGQLYWKSWEQKSMQFLATATSATIQFSVTNQQYDLGLDYIQVTPVASSNVSLIAGPVLTKNGADLVQHVCVTSTPPAVSSFVTTDPLIFVWFGLGGLTAQDSVLARFSFNGTVQPSRDYGPYTGFASGNNYFLCPSMTPTAADAGQ